jgi:hypothetical protein
LYATAAEWASITGLVEFESNAAEQEATALRDLLPLGGPLGSETEKQAAAALAVCARQRLAATQPTSAEIGTTGDGFGAKKNKSKQDDDNPESVLALFLAEKSALLREAAAMQRL